MNQQHTERASHSLHKGRPKDDRNTITHKRLIDAWIRDHPQFQRTRFSKEAWEAIEESERGTDSLNWEAGVYDGEYLPAEETELAKSLRSLLTSIIPDAYWVDAPNRTIVMYEAVNGHKISEAKRRRLVGLFLALDQIHWDFIIFAQWADGFMATVTGAKMLYADIEHRDELGA